MNVRAPLVVSVHPVLCFSAGRNGSRVASKVWVSCCMSWRLSLQGIQSRARSKIISPFHPKTPHLAENFGIWHWEYIHLEGASPKPLFMLDLAIVVIENHSDICWPYGGHTQNATGGRRKAGSRTSARQSKPVVPLDRNRTPVPPKNTPYVRFATPTGYINLELRKEALLF